MPLDLSQLSDEDVDALASLDLSKVSDEGLDYIASTRAVRPPVDRSRITFGPEVGPPTESQMQMERAANMDYFPGGTKGYLTGLNESAAPMMGARLLTEAARLPVANPGVAKFRRVPVKEIVKEAAEPFGKALKALKNPLGQFGTGVATVLGGMHLPKLPAKDAAAAGAVGAVIMNPVVMPVLIDLYRSGRMEDLRKELIDSVNKEDK